MIKQQIGRPKEQIVWGFPGAGGTFINKNTFTNTSLMAAASKVGSLNNLFDSTSDLKDFALILMGKCY